MGTTSKGIGPCYTDKVNRNGIRAKDNLELKDYLWDGTLEGKIYVKVPKDLDIY